MKKLFILLLLTPFALFSQQNDGAVANFHFVESEFDVKMNPTNSNNLVLSVFGLDNSHVNIYHTTNGGTTWTESTYHGWNDASHDGLTGDPVLAFSENGDLFFTHLASSTNETVDCAISKSTDGGVTWQNLLLPYSGLADKPWISIDNSATSSGHNNIYISLVENTVVKLHTIQLNNTTNQYEDVHSIQLTHGNALPTVVTKSDGTVIVSALDQTSPNKIYVEAFSNEGTQMIHSTLATSFPDYLFNAPSLSLRFQPAQYLAVDNTGGAHDGRIYLAYTAQEQGQSGIFDIYIMHSDDNGQNWSTPIPVHPSAAAGTNQFYSSITVNPEGKVVLSWFDRRDHPVNSNITDFYVGVSSDGGETFSDVKVNSASSDFNIIKHAGNDFGIGDYQNVIATNDEIYAFWADGREATTFGNGPVRVFMAKINIDNLLLSSIENIDTNISILNLYPNPATNAIHTVLTTKKDIKMKYLIYDTSGKIIYESNQQEFTSGKHQIDIDLNVKTGVYYILFKTDSKYLNLKRFVIK